MMITSSAMAWTHIVAFGDSLSDNGSEDGCGIQRFSNGDVWVEYFAEQMDCTLEDRAWGGAVTGGEDKQVPSLLEQVSEFTAQTPEVSKDTLITLWAGGNDLRTITPESDAASIIQNSVVNIGQALTMLISHGAETILIANMPNLGATPGMNKSEITLNAGNQVSLGFNSGLTAVLEQFSEADATIYLLDAYSVLNNWIESSEFDNVTDQFSEAEDTEQSYLFWDDLHPTTSAHSKLADEVFAVFQSVDESGHFCMNVKNDWNLDFPCVSFAGKGYGFTLKPQKTDVNQLGWIWQMDMSTFGHAQFFGRSSACLTISETLSLEVSQAALNGLKFKFNLIPFVDTQSEGGLFWEIEPGSFQLMEIEIRDL
ncbi:MAG: SGNH/GDSL hydrolase family protein [Thermodesulfobacteriota bacterium]|nr:SGNH/GDSL hydrolase family protein [Thermodesulfobacteriota bacterium]